MFLQTIRFLWQPDSRTNRNLFLIYLRYCLDETFTLSILSLSRGPFFWEGFQRSTIKKLHKLKSQTYSASLVAFSIHNMEYCKTKRVMIVINHVPHYFSHLYRSLVWLDSKMDLEEKLLSTNGESVYTIICEKLFVFRNSTL